MNAVEQTLADWKASLLPNIPIAGLLARNRVVYKRKAPFRSWMLREAVFWRITDLMTQSYALHQQGHALGARILLRSALETLATLIYLNQLIQQVLDGELSFESFETKTVQLLLGSKNDTTPHKSINVITVLEKCDKRYSGLMALYADLSESAHPSYEGLCWGYSTISYHEYETTFSNRWRELFGEGHLDAMEACMEIFHHEYNDVCAELMEKFEIWIQEYDGTLEASKDSMPQK